MKKSRFFGVPPRRVCGDGTDGGVLWDVRGECEGDGGTECEDSKQ
jgi:hypothetical protein